MVNQLDALLTHLGTGRWSVLHFIALAYGSIILPPHILGGAFMAPRLDYFCRVPNTFNPTATANLSFLYLETNYSYSIISSRGCQYTVDTPEGEVMRDCVEFDFDNSTFSSTFTSEYHLACGRGYLQTSFQSMYMFGFMVGAPVNGYLSDKYGRKRAVVTGVALYMVLGVTSAWLPLLSTILVARFFMGWLHVICFYSSYVLMVEVLEPKLRTMAGYFDSIFWAVGTMLYGGLAYWIRDWRVLQTAATLPGLLILPALWMIDESPRWLIVNRRPKDALRVLDKVARWHGVDLPHEAEMKKLVEEQASQARTTLQHPSVWLLVKSAVDETLVLVRTPRLRIITLCTYLNYMMMGMVYYGLSLSGASISDDPFLYMVLTGFMEVPAYIFTAPVVQRFGRKPPLLVFFLTTAVVLLALAAIPSVYSTTVLTLAMVGKLASTGGFQTAIFFSSELFPTEVRSRGIGTSSMMSRVGAMVSPFIRDLVGTVYPWAPFVVFGSGAFLAGAGTLLLPETRGQILPDTVVHLEARAREAPRRHIRLPRVLTSYI